MPTPTDDLIAAAKKAASPIDADVYVYNGTIDRGRDLKCIEAVFAHVGHPKAILFPVTGGGDPDAAYKITRYFQDRYESFTVVVSGLCKSAGTLMAIGAQELAFTPFGELGPLDIQLTKVDRFDSLQSGLTIQEALDTLESRAKSTFYSIVREYITANNGLMSFTTASKAAAEFVTQLYAPVFSRIDPEEVGARSRSMRIAIEYGRRLAVKGQNLRPDTLEQLAEKYASHSFVIDQREAASLFKHVREITKAEEAVVTALGMLARFEQPRGTPLLFTPLTERYTVPKKGVPDHAATDHARGGAALDRADSPRSNGKAKPAAKSPGRRAPIAVARAGLGANGAARSK